MSHQISTLNDFVSVIYGWFIAMLNNIYQHVYDYTYCNCWSLCSATIEICCHHLCSLFIRNCDIHEHYTICRNDPRAVARNSHIMNKSCICKGPELWGALPQNTKERKSISSFKRQIMHIQIEYGFFHDLTTIYGLGGVGICVWPSFDCFYTC